MGGGNTNTHARTRTHTHTHTHARTHMEGFVTVNLAFLMSSTYAYMHTQETTDASTMAVINFNNDLVTFVMAHTHTHPTGRGLVFVSSRVYSSLLWRERERK